MGDLLADGISRNGNRAGEEVVSLDEQQVGRTTADGDQQGTLRFAKAIGACAVVACHWRQVNQQRVEADITDRLGVLLDQVTLQHHRHDFQSGAGFRLLLRGNQLVVQADVLQGEGEVALGLELGQLSNLLLVILHVADASETQQRGLAGERDQRLTRLHAAFHQHLAQDAFHHAHAGLLRELLLVLPVGEDRHAQLSRSVNFEFAQLDTGGADIYGKEFLVLCHDEILVMLTSPRSHFT